MFRFLQLSDIRLGATPRLIPACVPSEALLADLRRDPFRALERALNLAAQHAVDAVLIAGALVSANDCTAEDLAELHRLVAQVAPTPVIVVTRAHGAGSPLDARTGPLLGIGEPPANLIVLESGSAPYILCDHAIVPGTPEHFLAEIPSILLTSTPVDAGTLETAWAWIAAGDSLEESELVADGVCRGGHTGAPVAHELPGPVGCAWLVSLEGMEADLTRFDTAPRRGHLLDVDISDVQRSADLASAARVAVEGATSVTQSEGRDLVWLRLSGAWRLPALPRLPAGALDELCASAWIEPADLVLSPPEGGSTLDLHLRALMARTQGDEPVRQLDAVSLALSAWQGES